MPKPTSALLYRLTVLGVVLFLSRALAELAALTHVAAWSIVAGVFGVVAGSVLVWVAKRRGISFPLPALILWVYVLWPFYVPVMALWIGLATILTSLIVNSPTNEGRVWLLDSGVFLAALIVYVMTLSPGLLPADAGEFQLVAAKLGVAHPPGYPLYTLLGWLFTRLTPANPAYGVNLFSAVTAALTVMLVGRAARRLSGSVWGELVASLLIAIAASFWSTATQASIRPLTAFFTALCAERLIAFLSSPAESRKPTLATFALAFGLGVAHHPSLIFPGVFFGIFLLLADPSLLRQPRRWLLPLGAFALGFLPWLYLPIRGAMGAALAPDGLATWRGFWDHVLARGFAGDLFSFRTPAELADRALIWWNILTLQWSLPVLVAALIGAGLLAWRNWRAGVMLIGGFLLHSAISMTYRAPQTVEYLIPAYVLLAIAAGAGWGFRPLKENATRLGWSAAASTLIVLIVAFGVREWPSFAALADDNSTHETAESLLENAPPDAQILASWHWAMPLQAMQSIDGTRPDVDVIYVYPDGAEPLAETWVRRIEASIAAHPVIVTSYYPVEFGATPYIYEPIDRGWQVRSTPRRDLPPSMTPWPGTVTFSNGLSLIGYQVIGDPRVGDVFEVRVAWRAEGPIDQDVTASVHLVNPNLSLAASDVLIPTSRARAGDVLISRHTIGMPPYGLPSPLDAYSLIASIYTLSPDGSPQQISYANRFTFVTLTSVDISPPIWPAPTSHPMNITFADGARITGADWEQATVFIHSQLPDGTFRTQAVSGEAATATAAAVGGGSSRLGPWAVHLNPNIRVPAPRPWERYIPLGGQMVLTRAQIAPYGTLDPGDTVTLDLTFLSAAPLTVDDVVKVDLIGEGYAWRDQSDHIPATGAIPALKWLWGWQVHDRHILHVPTDVLTTRAQAELVVYDHFTNSILPILDHTLAQRSISVPLAVWGQSNP